MTSNRGDKGSHRIPIRFTDADDEAESAENTPADMDRSDPDNEELEMMSPEELDAFLAEDEPGSEEAVAGGPATAELIATRAELKRVEAENADLKDRLARRQADFENYRKRVDKERTETYNRVVADVAANFCRCWTISSGHLKPKARSSRRNLMSFDTFSVAWISSTNNS